MIKLTLPDINAKYLYTECIKGIADDALRLKLQQIENEIEAAETVYLQKADLELICEIAAINKNQNPIVAGNVLKSDLTKLYDQYLVPKVKSAREYYDEIFVAVNGVCPFCAGIGTAKTLDHFLPKTNFPIYSVTPANLVPCCRDCNTEKSTTYATIPEKQCIHPYLDNDRYFTERWLTATIVPTDPVSISFSIAAPLNWDDCYKQRVGNHFYEYGLAARFSKAAGAEISTIVDMRKGIMMNCSNEDFRDQLAGTGHDNKYLLNGWKRTMYIALSQSPWFCSKEF